MAYSVVKKWAVWSSLLSESVVHSEVVVAGLFSYEAAVSEAKARFSAQSVPWAGFVVEDDGAGKEGS